MSYWILKNCIHQWKAYGFYDTQSELSADAVNKQRLSHGRKLEPSGGKVSPVVATLSKQSIRFDISSTFFIEVGPLGSYPYQHCSVSHVNDFWMRVRWLVFSRRRACRRIWDSSTDTDQIMRPVRSAGAANSRAEQTDNHSLSGRSFALPLAWYMQVGATVPAWAL